MAKTKYQVRLDKKTTDSYCVKYSILEVSTVLRKDQKSDLWNKRKSTWTIEDWKEFFKLNIDNYDN